MTTNVSKPRVKSEYDKCDFYSDPVYFECCHVAPCIVSRSDINMIIIPWNIILNTQDGVRLRASGINTALPVKMDCWQRRGLFIVNCS